MAADPVHYFRIAEGEPLPDLKPFAPIAPWSSSRAGAVPPGRTR
jgi:hypothetical protein